MRLRLWRLLGDHAAGRARRRVLAERARARVQGRRVLSCRRAGRLHGYVRVAPERRRPMYAPRRLRLWSLLRRHRPLRLIIRAGGLQPGLGARMPSGPAHRATPPLSSPSACGARSWNPMTTTCRAAGKPGDACEGAAPCGWDPSARCDATSRTCVICPDRFATSSAPCSTAADLGPERRGLGCGGRRVAEADVLQGAFDVGVSENLAQPPGGRSAQRDQRGERVAAVVVEVCRRDPVALNARAGAARIDFSPRYVPRYAPRVRSFSCAVEGDRPARCPLGVWA